MDPAATGSEAEVVPSLTEALRLAQGGDTIHVMPGHYRENLVVDKAVRIVSTSGAGFSILDGASAAGPGVTLREPATLEGLTIARAGRGTGASSDGGGVRIDLPNPGDRANLIGCVIADNETGGRGGAVFVAGGSLRMVGCTVADNVAATGSGLYNQATDNDVELVNTLLWNTEGDGLDVAGQTGGVSQSHTLMRDPVSGEVLVDGVGQGVTDPGLSYYWTLAHDSPARDAGLNGREGGPDVDGESRVDGLVDIGADEFVSEDGDALPDWWERLFFGNLRVTENDDTERPKPDGLINKYEYLLGFDPTAFDSTGSGQSDLENAMADTSYSRYPEEWSAAEKESAASVKSGEDLSTQGLLLNPPMALAQTSGSGAPYVIVSDPAGAQGTEINPLNRSYFASHINLAEWVIENPGTQYTLDFESDLAPLDTLEQVTFSNFEGTGQTLTIDFDAPSFNWWAVIDVASRATSGNQSLSIRRVVNSNPPDVLTIDFSLPMTAVAFTLNALLADDRITVRFYDDPQATTPIHTITGIAGTGTDPYAGIHVLVGHFDPRGIRRVAINFDAETSNGAHRTLDDLCFVYEPMTAVADAAGPGELLTPPGDVLAANDSARDATVEIQYAIAQAKLGGYEGLALAPGTYHFQSVGQFPGRYSHVVMDTMSDFVLDGQGALFEFYSRNASGITAENCTNVGIRNLTLDYSNDFPQTHAAVATRDTAGYGSMTFSAVEGRSADDFHDTTQDANNFANHLRLFAMRGGNKREGTTRMRTLDASLSDSGATITENNSYNNVADVTPGDVMIITERGQVRNALEFTVQDFSRLGNLYSGNFVENVTVHASPAFAIALNHQENARVENCRVEPRPGRMQFLSSNADGIHIADGGPNIKILNNRVKYTGDDGIAVNQRMLGFVTQIFTDPTEVELEIDARYGNLGTTPATDIAFVSTVELAELGEATIQSELLRSAPVSGKVKVKVKLSNAITGLSVGDMITVPKEDRNPGILIQGNTVDHVQFSRGIVLGGCWEGEVRNNVVQKTNGAGIMVQMQVVRDGGVPDLGGTFTPNHGCVIAENTVIQCPGWGAGNGTANSGGAIEAFLQDSSLVWDTDNPNTTIKMTTFDLTIENNLIIESDRHGITLGNTDGVTVSNNTMHFSVPVTNPYFKVYTHDFTYTGNTVDGVADDTP